ncbi:hypothetical protein LOTGIDRAFT_239408 [Lottia gigantea]|uniref:Aquaporin n=1 Tax=Lottia gigantea TaxID=225164 RepID=V4APQ4_LOTGI|nr:hypothetical protein LOTGIDRAFT_239408 [Lottia gigantea]ESO95616.1 hypothetical protein LOTGIDRAFT_239408 [Lottia gigantea]
MNHWKDHWVYWAGPLTGGIVSGLLYEYIFDPRRSRRKPAIPPETSSYPDFEDNDDITSIPQQMPTSPNHATHYNNTNYGNGVAETRCSTHCAENHYTAHLRSPERHSSHSDMTYEPVGRRSFGGYNPVNTDTPGLENEAYQAFDTNPRRIPPPPPRNKHYKQRNEEISLDDVSVYQGRHG